MSDKRVDILTTETLEGDTLTLHGITQAQTDQIIKNQNDITQLNTDLTNEIERAESKETELNSLISSETSRAESKESELNSLISSETSRAETKESELNSLITSETSRAESKETELNSLISSETTRAETKESELNSLISSETSRAETKESELNSLISSEVTRAETKETELNSLISSETSRAESKESELNSLISSETTRATEREKDLQSAITAEANRAEQAEAQIKTSETFFYSVNNFVTFIDSVSTSTTSTFNCLFTKNITNNEKQLFGFLSIYLRTTTAIGNEDGNGDFNIGSYPTQLEIDGITYTLDFIQNDFKTPVINLTIDSAKIPPQSYNYSLRSYKDHLFVTYYYTKEIVTISACIPTLIKLTPQ